MPLILRVDVDRPYGRFPAWRHVLSRIASDAFLPAIERFGYLQELATVLQRLNERHVAAHIFFRRCTAPSTRIVRLLETGGHEVGLHLEDSRSFDSFVREKAWLERFTGKRICSFSKHGSGGAKFGRRHYAPYEPDKYVAWGQRMRMRCFLGNLEDPTLSPRLQRGLTFFPSAFWLEPSWRDVDRFTTQWLRHEVTAKDIVLLIHPENVLADAALTREFVELVSTLPVKLT